MIRQIIRPILVLLALCIVISGAVSVTYFFTADKIAAQAEEKINENLTLLLPGTVDKTETECDAFVYYDCADAAGAALGRAYLIDAKGYGGPISLMVGIKADGTVAGISILSSTETPGLGKKAENSEFYGQFSDKDVDVFTVVKGSAASDDQISAISGATISSKAITNAVNTVLTHFNGGEQ
ncbi:MAG TPA: FMN-binding protein [Clostridiales bacterium]|nr:FMN-binding protein [Clostridiales bacterium]